MSEGPETYYSRDPASYAEATQRENMPESFLQVRETFLDNLDDKDIVLDVGCGPGHDAAYFEEQGYDATGVDVAPGMVEEARERYDAPVFAETDMRDLGVLDDTYDGVWCNSAIFHVSEQEMQEAVDELYRVMEPGGTLQIAYKLGEGTLTKSENEGELLQYLVSDDAARGMLEDAGFAIDEELSRVTPVPMDDFEAFSNYFCYK